MDERIGFIGQGWIGKHYADDFERRGYAVVRYGLEEVYAGNREAIGECSIVFIAVPTPTTPDGFDDSILRSVLPLIGKGNVAVIKSTIVPGTTEALQAAFPDIHILHSPEFLREAHAAEDAAHPARNIIGVPGESRDAAERVMKVLPPAPFARIMPALEAELVKYAGNTFLMLKVLYANLLYDLSGALGAEYNVVREALAADPRIGPSHLNPLDTSGHTTVPGRGAGGHCFIKDFEAFRRVYEKTVSDPKGSALLEAVIAKNIELLTNSGKDIELLEAVYGPRPS